MMKNIKKCINPVYVSAPLLPDISNLFEVVKQIWQSGYVTNNGPFNQKFEEALKKYLNVPTALTFNNGTSALMVALKMFNLKPGSEVITTPMTFAATAHSVVWNGFVPVFADIRQDDLTLDPEAVEMAVKNSTSAILATHVYGSICDIDALRDIAEKYSLKLIFDAAHAFGSTYKGQSVGLMGDASIFSFHATKLFTTLEGGLLTTPYAEDKDIVYLLRNFGIKNEEEVVSIGINGKMNELQAAIGLLNLPLIKKEIERRAKLRAEYSTFLTGLPGIKLQPVQEREKCSEQYFPLLIDKTKFGRNRDEIYETLRKNNIYARKYFHPICTDFLPYKAFRIVSKRKKPLAEQVKNQVLCLPFHSGVKREHIDVIRNVFTAQM